MTEFAPLRQSGGYWIVRHVIEKPGDGQSVFEVREREKRNIAIARRVQSVSYDLARGMAMQRPSKLRFRLGSGSPTESPGQVLNVIQ